MIKGKKIIIGITGGIAAYKTVVLVRELIKLGAQIRVVITKSASEFVTPLTLSTLSQHKVYSEFRNTKTGVWENHVDLGMWADLFLIAPLSANTLSKMVNGMCDNFLIATYLSAKCPIMVAPAMDLDMYKHFSTSENLIALEKNGTIVIPAETGELASGLYGKGRMAEIRTIIDKIETFFLKKNDLKGKKILITAGPTIEKIDPVRFISNYSTGKMGISLAKEAASRGGEVILLLGPTKLSVKNHNIKIIRFETAEQLLKEVKCYFPKCDIGIFSAAVSDYKPIRKSKNKIKKEKNTLSIEFIKNPDTLMYAGQIKTQQLLVGFALETNNEIENANKKLTNKNLDFIILNSLRDKGAGFEYDTNKIKILTKGNKIQEFELKSKEKVATDIFNVIIESYA